MMAFSRVAYVCKCRARVPTPTKVMPDVPLQLSVRLGGAADIHRLPVGYGDGARASRLLARLQAGELFVIGEIEGRIVSCTWLRLGGTFSLHHLPTCEFELAAGVAYGHDAFTDEALQGRGIRRAVFAEELRILEQLGVAWEVSYFVDHQLDGGRRTLSRIGVPLIELWRVTVRRDGSVALAALSEDGTVTPAFDHVREEA